MILTEYFSSYSIEEMERDVNDFCEAKGLKPGQIIKFNTHAVFDGAPMVNSILFIAVLMYEV